MGLLMCLAYQLAKVDNNFYTISWQILRCELWYEVKYWSVELSPWVLIIRLGLLLVASHLVKSNQITCMVYVVCCRPKSFSMGWNGLEPNEAHSHTTRERKIPKEKGIWNIHSGCFGWMPSDWYYTSCARTSCFIGEINQTWSTINKQS